ncbi:hypothetical protein DEM34_10650 [Spiribacter halobius]|uniref:HTH cro/C1-type domain-containing protein n=2 Tax=Sediminicurvatus halobius TaxID=2182432 RepID=A0A2U2N194_9GAMM|nr:hypothetical protein DEM34_10650 [Spiribacter halobius]
MLLGYTQSGIARECGSKLRSWQDYEAGVRTPGAQVIAGLARLGINANWLLTGEGEPTLGPIPQSQTQSQGSGSGTHHTETAQGISTQDLALLENVILEIRRQLERRGTELPPEIEARIARMAFELCAIRRQQPVESTVANVIELAAYR